MTFNTHLLKPISIIVVCAILLAANFALTAPVAADSSASLKTYESDASQVAASGTWNPFETVSASGGRYLISGGNNCDDTLTLEFEGTYLAVIYVTHPTNGKLAIEVDGVVMRTVNTSGRLAFDQRSEIDYLSDGEHVVKLYSVDGPIAVDAISIMGTEEVETSSDLSRSDALSEVNTEIDGEL